jgi:hypothetical protein
MDGGLVGCVSTHSLCQTDCYLESFNDCEYHFVESHSFDDLCGLSSLPLFFFFFFVMSVVCGIFTTILSLLN